MDLLVIIYISIALFAFIIYLFNLFELKAKKKQIGTIHTQWSSMFNLTIKVNWIIWAVVMAYLSWSLFLVIAEPRRKSEYIFLLVFVLFLSFYPRWTAVIGSKGIIFGMEVFLRENLKEWIIFSRGRQQYLELKWESRSVPSKLKVKRIPLPANKAVTLPPVHN